MQDVANTLKIRAVKKLRRFARYHLGGLIFFWWRDEKGRLQRGRGVTRNISAKGIFAVTPTPPPPDALLRYDVLVPDSSDSGLGWWMRAAGRVLRTESLPCVDGEPDGFAALSNRFVLRSEVTDWVDWARTVEQEQRALQRRNVANEE